MPHPSRVVVGERVPTVTALSSAAETTLSSSPNTAPRISTSSRNVTGEDVRRVIRRHPTSSLNRALVGAGTGRGSTKRPTEHSAGRGQGLAGMIAGNVSAGRGRSAPSPPVGRSQQRERQASSRIESGHSPAVTMHLDPQGPTDTYSEAASRPPRRAVAPPPELPVCDMRLKLAAREKEKEAARATLSRIREQECEEEAAHKKREGQELRRVRRRDGHAQYGEKELNSRKSITRNAEPREPALTLSPTLWGGVNMSGPGKVHMRVPHGLGTCGAPAPWVTNS